MNERTDDDSETGRQRQSEDLSQQGMSDTCSESNKRQRTNTIRYFSMFSGVGGFELGFERANALSTSAWNESRGNEENSGSTKPVTMASQQFTCIGQSEWDKYSSQVLRYRFPNIKNWGDCTKIKPEDLPDFDMLCGGFPCQAFSIAGKRRGFEDIRGTMFFEVARILQVKRPKTVLLENVKGLLNHDKGKTFRVILQTLDELGYEVQWMVLNSKFHGVPQNRERVLIIGSLRGTGRPQILPFGCNDSEVIGEGTVTRTFTAGGHSGGLHSDSTGIVCYKKSKSQQGRIYETEGVSPTLAGASKLSGDCTPRIRAVLTPDRAEKRQNGRRFKEPGEPSFTVTGQDIHGVAIMNLYNKKEHTDRCPTLTEPHHNTLRVREEHSIRRLTPTECCRLQGFPDNWTEYGIDDKGVKVKMSDTQRYKQMGNAVTTNVIKAVGSQILNSTSRGKE